MGVVTLMELIRYLAIHRTKRTAIFNINNGEEDGLKGAFAYDYFSYVFVVMLKSILASFIIPGPK